MDQNALTAAGVKTEIDKVSSSFCLAKWYQVTLNLENGITRSCHHVIPHHFDEKLLEKNPSALHNTSEKKTARHQMLKGARPSECSYCWSIEDAGGVSDRYYKSSEDWAHPQLEAAVASGSTQDVFPTYLEMSFDNVCNFKCSYCSPTYSTAWGAEIKKFGDYPRSGLFRSPLVMNAGGAELRSPEQRKLNSQAFWNWWPELGSKLEHLRITGGEPLLSRETWALFDRLAEKPQPHLNFSVNSNLSAPIKTLDELIGKINALNGKIKSFILYVSVDCVGPQAEYIRDGLNYSAFMLNIDQVLERVEWPITVSFMISVNAMSLPGLEPLLKVIHEKRNRFLQKNVYFDVPYLERPSNQSVRILPKSWKHYLEASIAFMKSTQRGNGVRGFLDSEVARVERILQLMNHPDISESHKFFLRKDFAIMFNEYDRRRSKNFLETFPEHRNFWKYCNFICNFKSLAEAKDASQFDLSIVIPSGGSPSRLKACLSSIKNQTASKSTFEVLVGLKDRANSETRDAILNSGIENIQIVTHPQGGANELRNLAAATATGKWIQFLDDDCLLETTSSIEDRILKHQSSLQNLVLSGDYQNDAKTSWFGRSYNLVATSWLLARGQTNGSPRFLGGNMSLSRRYFRDIAFDETLINGGEELELASRLVQQGANVVYERTFSVVHRSDHTLGSFLKRAWQHGSAIVGSAREQKKTISKSAALRLLKGSVKSPSTGFLSLLYFVTTKVSRLWHRFWHRLYASIT